VKSKKPATINTEELNHRITESQDHRITESQDYRITGSQKYITSNQFSIV